MITARRVGRWVLFGLAGLGAAVLVLRVGLGLYLGSERGREAVAERLGSMIGLPVEVADLDVGSRTSSVKFRVLDPKLDKTSPGAEVVSVESASADVSFAALVTGGAHPKELHLRGVNIALRLDASGKILTTLPEQTESQARPGGPLPLVTLEAGKVRVHQEGRPEFALSGVSLEAVPSGDVAVLSGAIDDPGWGKWKVSGEVNRATNTGWVDLATDDGVLTTDRLKSIPYIPLSVWENVRPEGRAKAVAHFAVGPGNEFKYDVTVQGKGPSLGIPAAEVTLTDVRAVVRVHDGLVEVAGPKEKSPATGKLAGGTVGVSAKWDYGREPAVADPLLVTADKLAVKDLPASWGLKNLGGQLPGKLNLDDGILSGRAKLRLVAHADGRVETYGGGTGRIDLPNFFGGSGSIGVTLGGKGQKLEFGSGPSPAPAKEPPVMLRDQAGPLAASRPAEREAASGSVPRTLSVTVTSERELLALVAFLAVQPKADPPAEPRTDQTNLDATITLRDIDIAQFLEQLELKVPYKVAGRVTVQARLGVPLGEVATRASYRLTGTLTSPQLAFEGLTVRDLTTEVNYQNGKLTLTALRGSVPQPDDPAAKPGTFSGTASAALDPVGDLTARLTLDRIPLGPVAAAVPGLGVAVGGIASGKADFTAPFDKLDDMTTWNGSAAVTSDLLTVAGRTAKGVALTATVARGMVTLKEAAATIEGVPLTGSGSLALTGKYKFDATVKTTGTSITDLRRLVPEAELPLPVEGVLETASRVAGTLSPLAFTASGHVTATKLTLNKSAANHIDAKWEVTQDRLRLTDLSAGVFGGTVSGSLDYPFDPKQSGKFNVAFKDVDAAAAVAFIPSFNVPIGGQVTGKLAGAILPERDGQGRLGDFDLDLTAPKLTLYKFKAERLSGKLTVKGGKLDYLLKADLADGSIEIKPTPAPDKKPPAKGAPGRGTARVTGLNLARLASDLGLRALAPLRGRLDMTFEFAHDLSEGSGRVSIEGLGWGNTGGRDDLTGVLVLRDGALELRELTGVLARGRLSARGRVFVDTPARNYVSVSLTGAEAERLFAPIPGLAGVVGGRVSVVVRATLGRTVRGSGTVTLSRGAVGGSELSGLTIPFDYSVSPGGFGRFAVREATTHGGAGRTSGALTAYWGPGAGATVTGQVRFVDVPLRAIAPNLGGSAFLGNGRITGRFDLRGTNVRTADDLTGTLVAVLNNTSVREVPLLQQAVPYLNPLGVTKPFQSGDVRATLSGGVFRVHRLALANPSAQLVASGTIRTSTGLLDLDVVAHTGQIGPDVRGLRALGLRLPAFGPIPIALVRDVSTFLSNRTVRLTITGTVANPVVRVNARALLTEEAVRFFLTRYVVPAPTAEFLGIGSAGSVLGGTSGNRP